MKRTMGPPAGGGGGASRSTKLSRSVSSIVISSAISSLSDSTGMEGRAGGGGISNCSVGGISMVSTRSVKEFALAEP